MAKTNVAWFVEIVGGNGLSVERLNRTVCELLGLENVESDLTVVSRAQAGDEKEHRLYQISEDVVLKLLASENKNQLRFFKREGAGKYWKLRESLVRSILLSPKRETPPRVVTSKIGGVFSGKQLEKK